MLLAVRLNFVRPFFFLRYFQAVIRVIEKLCVFFLTLAAGFVCLDSVAPHCLGKNDGSKGGVFKEPRTPQSVVYPLSTIFVDFRD